MAIQTVSKSKTNINSGVGSLEYFVQIGNFFTKEQNRELKFDDYWTYEKINSLLWDWAVVFNPELKNASLEEIVAFLEKLNEEELTQNTIPASQIEQLEEELAIEEASEEEIKQNAAEKANEEITKIYLKKQFKKRLTQSPIEEKEKVEIVKNILSEVQNELPNSGLRLLLEKQEQSPLGEKQQDELSQKALQEFTEVWEKSVEKTAAKRNLSAEKTTYLKTFSFPAFEALNLQETLPQVSQFQQQIDQREEKTTSLKTDDEISYLKEKIKSVELNQTENLTSALSPAFSPQKADVFGDQFFEYFPANLVRYGSAEPTPLEIEKATVVSLWQMIGSEIQLKPEEVKSTIDSLTSFDKEQFTGYVKTFKAFAPSSLSSEPKKEERKTVFEQIKRQLLSGRPILSPSLDEKTHKEIYKIIPPPVNLLGIKNEEGRTVFEQVKQQLLLKGANLSPESDNQLKNFRYQTQATEAIYQGLKKEDLQAKVDKLISKGVRENSPQITELRQVIIQYDKILATAQENGFPPKQIKNWFTSGPSRVALSFTSTRLTVEKINWAEIIKNKQKLVSSVKNFFAVQSLSLLGLGKGQPKISLGNKTKIFSSFSFIGGSLGKGLGFTLEKILSPRLIRNLGESLAGIFSGQNRTVNSFVSGVNNLLRSIANPQFKTSGFGMTGKIFIGFFALVLFIVIVLIPGAFTSNADYVAPETSLPDGQPGDSTPGGPVSGPATYPEIRCSSPRHLSEKVVCLITQGSVPCNQSVISTSTVRNYVLECIDQQKSTFPSYAIFREMFLWNKNAFSLLQCLRFVNYVTQALGQNFDNYLNAAGLYYNEANVKSTYKPIVSVPLKTGDIVVWPGSPGHIAIYLGSVYSGETPDPDANMVIAEADGYTGILSVRTRSVYGKSGRVKFYRYCPGKSLNCQ